MARISGGSLVTKAEIDLLVALLLLAKGFTSALESFCLLT